MEITEAQYQRIAHCLPVQRGNVRLANRQISRSVSGTALTDCVAGRLLSAHPSCDAVPRLTVPPGGTGVP